MLTKKVIWIIVSCLMTLSLVMASCGGTTAEEEEEEMTEEEEEMTEEEEEMVEEDELLPPETPKYGGTHTAISLEPFNFDPSYAFMVECNSLYMTSEELLMGDWAKGPNGTGETDWTTSCLGFIDLCAGQLCESWEFKDDRTLLFNIRQGVHWFDKPPMNGRELTAEDVAWGITRLWTAQAGIHRVAGTPEQALIEARATDKYTLELEFPPEGIGVAGVIYSATWAYIVPREVVETYGDMQNWRNVCGTGAWMIEDYVRGSSLTYVKNPNYWQYDPLHPENQLPYADKVKHLFITDQSTQNAALRSGKIDCSYGYDITLDDALLLLDQRPELMSKTTGGQDKHLYFRMDKEELPFKDLRVRQALTIAINQQEIIDDYYKGEANMLATPYPPYKPWAPFYTPLEEQNETVQELFSYNPEKAKQMLADAGYPDGFKCSILSGTSSDTDFLSIIKEYFADVGVELEINQVEYGVFRGMRRSRSYDMGVYTSSPTASFPYDMHNVREESFDCFSYYEHPKTRAAYNEERTYLARDDAEYARVLREIAPFIIEQCVAVWLPAPAVYRLWWPWLQNYHGEGSMGIDDRNLYTNYIWVDEDLKKSMGY